ncbi:fumarylacetoacetate hydrolase family protein [Paenibacillus barcinonensis]|uniref:2-keto-4-pentenoate hydratase/2-oxohepta-3-ene-1,7-dioic acid hydratase in catechol pathway n=1 Tax=Paenibacillus barcinonensis TaxID=198119 RepID=A0A2V4VBL9_PAEBA|nr:fumarylacetoacetate hydrolase family protein [Paenibacillus barcinonensis]PYE50623.1 2-keto-4-pentenoate hydratase/2-oxohepta-3-ene-1,7-dioic acid hydratase in catechol pathway [Paenibacillus barcinonensis]QKS57317.1 fumarylacetoacetate hydrolase family protein [Paenibacillus barcinonensis]
MKLVTIEHKDREQVAFWTNHGVIPMTWLNEQAGTDWNTDLLALLQHNQFTELHKWYNSHGQAYLSRLPYLAASDTTYRALFRRPGKIIGVGLNYREKAIEISGQAAEEEPVIFIKPDSTLIGPGESIQLPSKAGQVTAEAELALVIGQTCKNINEEQAMSVVAGFTTSLDMTAKEIHARNPRFMQRAKSFDTFLSLGSSLSTPDEYSNLDALEIKTMHNGRVAHSNTVSSMIFSPAYLIAFLSEVMTLHAGDVILTGTPGSVTIQAGDKTGCEIAGLMQLNNVVES